jgi:4-diphosphocytidyl-2-C-methyl-D-erythritol kinase
MTSSNEVVVRAPAKINLIIRVLDRLANGYHRLWSIMHTVDLFDVIRIRLNSHHNTITLHCGNPNLPKDRGNLVYRAAELMLQQSEARQVGLDIELTKLIPMAAGLGGGSSDAAAAMFGLNRLLQLHWSDAQLCQKGAVLGSDIPFFFQAPCALVRGWGQDVVPFHVQGERWAVLVNPGFPIETKWAYSQLAERRRTVSPLSEFAVSLEQKEVVQWDHLLSCMENDFELCLFSQYPILGFIKKKLRALGAEAALLSGSGATVFGIFHDKETAGLASVQLQKETRWHVFDVPMGQSCLPHDAFSWHDPTGSSSGCGHGKN